MSFTASGGCSPSAVHTARESDPVHEAPAAICSWPDSEPADPADCVNHEAKKRPCCGHSPTDAAMHCLEHIVIEVEQLELTE